MNNIAPTHSVFGGSVAARVLRCPASVHLVAKVPEHLRKSSAYADRGTACHTAMSRLIEGAVASVSGMAGGASEPDDEPRVQRIKVG